MSITSWTSNGMTWDTCLLKTPYPCMEAVRLAIIERKHTIGRAAEGIDLEAFTSLRCNSYYAQMIDENVTDMIPYFANHTDSNGNWQGVITPEDIAPAWTEETILAAIGDDKRILSSEVGSFSAAWLIQQYKIINMLRWSRKIGRSGVTKTKSYSGSGLDFSTALANAKQAYDAGEWTEGGAPSEAFQLSQSHFDVYNGSNEYHVDYISYAGNASYITQIPLYAGIQKQVDIYALITKKYEKDYPNVINEFASNEGYAENVWSLICTVPENYLTTVVSPIMFENRIVDPDEPTTIDVYYNKSCKINGMYPWQPLSPVCVLKYDGPNGFKFKDW